MNKTAQPNWKFVDQILFGFFWAVNDHKNENLVKK